MSRWMELFDWRFDRIPAPEIDDGPRVRRGAPPAMAPDTEWPSKCPGCGTWRFISRMTAPYCGPARLPPVVKGPYR